MAHALRQLTRADREKVHNRVESLEQRIDAEVVCAVASESGRYDRAESLCGLTVGVLALISAQKIAVMGSWQTVASLDLLWQVLLVVGGFVAGSVLASYWHGLRRLFVGKTEMAAEVARSVHQVFSQYGIGSTRHRGGLLIYLSLFEHQLQIRCDHAAAAKLAPADLEAIRDAVLAKVRQGAIADALIAGLDKAEERLANVLPRTGEIHDALHNDVLVFHPRP